MNFKELQQIAIENKLTPEEAISAYYSYWIDRLTFEECAKIALMVIAVGEVIKIIGVINDERYYILSCLW